MHPNPVRYLSRLMLCWLAALLLVACGVGTLPETTPTPINNPEAPPTPTPDLSPQDVVRIQVESLRNNDTPTPDSGIRTAFLFASPGNKRTTGPIERFIELVKNPVYSGLLTAQNAVYGEPEIEDGQASVEVILTDPQGGTVRYLFVLSLQADWPYEDCWMTDAVIRLSPPQRDTEIT